MNHYALTMTLGPVLFVLPILACIATAEEKAPDNDARAREFIRRFEATVQPAEIEANRQWWNASISGKDADYQKKEEAETRLETLYSDPIQFAQLKAIHESPIRDPLVARQITTLYLAYLPRQVEPALLKEMVAVANDLQKQFSVFRARVGQREMTENDVRHVLRTSKDSAQRQAAWEASKRVGPLLAPQLKRLVALRNQAARKLGYKDYHVMQLALGEQDQDQLLKLFDELDALTREPFHAAKAEIDAELARRHGITVAQLRPWHYHDVFFQDPPEVLGDNNDGLYAKIDIPKVCREYYAGIGLPVDDVLRRSDLFERPGKNPHGFCTDIDRSGDVRVLVNIVPDRNWLATLLHELGHATYSSKNIPATLPYALRTDSHNFLNEGVAMMFERGADNAAWLRAMGVEVPDAERFQKQATKLKQNQSLVFSRWCQVMFRFEKELYARPDQDLSRLWWDLVERYQEIRRPEGRNEPDYATKIHIVMSPVYYHNYMLGEMFAAQLHQTIAREVLGGADPATAIYCDNPAVGQFMKRRVFEPGRTVHWSELVRHATGEPLNAKAYAREIGRK